MCGLGAESLEFDLEDSIDFSFDSGEESAFSVDGSPDDSFNCFDDSFNCFDDSFNGFDDSFDDSFICFDDSFDDSFNGFDFSLNRLSGSLNRFVDSFNGFDDSLDFSLHRLSGSLNRFLSFSFAFSSPLVSKLDSLFRPPFPLPLPHSSPLLSLLLAFPIDFLDRFSRSLASSTSVVSFSATFAVSPQLSIHSTSNSPVDCTDDRCDCAKLFRREFATLDPADSLKLSLSSSNSLASCS